MLDPLGSRASVKHPATSFGKPVLRCASRNSNGPSVVIWPPSNCATTRREKYASHENALWLRSVMEKAISTLHHTVLINAVILESAAFFYFHSTNFP
jgi:hypothetical protein